MTPLGHWLWAANNEYVVIGVILGTVSNAAYIEHVNDVPSLQGELTKSGNMVINTEWSNFSSPCLLITKYDQRRWREPKPQRAGVILRSVLLKISTQCSTFGNIDYAGLRSHFTPRNEDSDAICPN